jgi:hypothetical protein
MLSLDTWGKTNIFTDYTLYLLYIYLSTGSHPLCQRERDEQTRGGNKRGGKVLTACEHVPVCLVADGRSDVVVPFRSERDSHTLRT